MGVGRRKQDQRGTTATNQGKKGIRNRKAKVWRRTSGKKKIFQGRVKFNREESRLGGQEVQRVKKMGWTHYYLENTRRRIGLESKRRNRWGLRGCTIRDYKPGGLTGKRKEEAEKKKGKLRGAYWFIHKGGQKGKREKEKDKLRHEGRENVGR